MQKLLGASLLLLSVTVGSSAFAMNLDCKFKAGKVAGVESIQISQDVLVINNNLAIPLDQSSIKCGHFGRQSRFDGATDKFRVILKTCTNEAVMQGYLIDSKNVKSAEVVCDEI